MFLDLLLSKHGDRLLRLKGIVELAEDPARPLVVHAVQSLLHPPAGLPAWPDAERGTRLVLIAIDLPEDYVRRLFAAIAGSPAVDTPDRAALADNPLAIAGYPRLESGLASFQLHAPLSIRNRWPPSTAARLDQPVPELAAEGRNVDCRQRVGGLQPEPAAGCACARDVCAP